MTAYPKSTNKTVIMQYYVYIYYSQQIILCIHVFGLCTLRDKCIINVIIIIILYSVHACINFHTVSIMLLYHKSSYIPGQPCGIKETVNTIHLQFIIKIVKEVHIDSDPFNFKHIIHCKISDSSTRQVDSTCMQLHFLTLLAKSD